MPGVVLIVIVINEWVAHCLINIHNYVLQSLRKPARKTLDIATRWRRRQYLSIFKFSVIFRLKDYKKVAEPPITEDMVDAQGIVFLTAGFETTANTLGSLIFHVATHPDIQNRGKNKIKFNLR